MKVEILSKRRVFDAFFKVDEATLRYERFDGRMSNVVARLSFERGDSVAALLFNVDTRRILLTDQFKYPAYENGPGWITEVLAGTINPGEQPHDALVREVMEEAGYRIASSGTPIGTFYVSPGGSSERIHLSYVEVRNADKVANGGGVAAENEDVRVVEWTIDEATNAVNSGSVADAKTLVALMWLMRRNESRGENSR